MFQRRPLPRTATVVPAEHQRTTEPPAPPADFFQPGTDYRLDRDYDTSVLTHFRCVAVDRHPGTNAWVAFGWWAQGITQPREPRGMDTYEWGRGWKVVRRHTAPTPADIARGLS